MPTKTQIKNRKTLLTVYRTKQYEGKTIIPTHMKYVDEFLNEVTCCALGLIGYLFQLPRYIKPSFDEFPKIFGITKDQAEHMHLRTEFYFEGWDDTGDDHPDYPKHSFDHIAAKLESFWAMCDAWNAENPE